MEVDKVSDKVTDMVVDMKVNMVADMVLDMVVDFTDMTLIIIITIIIIGVPNARQETEIWDKSSQKNPESVLQWDILLQTGFYIWNN